MRKEGLFDVEVYERGNITNTEQAVDNALQLNMYKKIFWNNHSPKIIVLITGDGNGFREGQGFLRTIYDLYTIGMGIELMSWKHSCNEFMRYFVEDKGVFVALDDYYESITYIECGRQSKELSLVNRKNASPNYEMDPFYRLKMMESKYKELQADYDKLKESYTNLLENQIEHKRQVEENSNKTE